ncbi:Transcriptional regulatory protein DegU [Thermoflexales bacterium]|nr:Transcriptional regulatory protein DegU [Thermoflexales bacterium]
MKAIRVLIVDDVAQVRRELRTLLPLLAAIEVVGEAEHGQRAIELAAALRPEVIIMDVEMPIVDGLAATRTIKQLCPSCRIVILSIHGEETVRTMARLAGADAFVDKGAPLAALLQAIQLDSETTPPSLRGASFVTKQAPP